MAGSPQSTSAGRDPGPAEATGLAALAQLSNALNGAVNTEEVCRLVVRGADSVVGASFANVALVDTDAKVLRVISPDDIDPDIERRWRTLPLDASRTPFHDVCNSGEAVFVLDTEERRGRYPHMVEDTLAAGLEATAALPLIDADGHVFGMLGLGWPTSVQLGPQLRARLDLLADLCSQSLQRTRRTDAQQHLVRLLQDELLAYLDAPSDLDVAVGYQSAQADIAFGGDWYDVIAVSPTETALVVGDIAGHGVQAAVQMAVAKSSIRSLVLTAPSLEDVLPNVNRSLAHLGSAYVATVVVALVDTERHVLRCTVAGHPPPVVRNPGEPAWLLWGSRQPPIGMPVDAVPVRSHDFPAGSILVLYSDGLVERRRVELDERLAVLRELVDGLPEGIPAAEARDVILQAMVDDDTSDDVAIVVVRQL